MTERALPSKAAAREARIARLLAHYRPLDGVADELLTADGAIRPVWAEFVAALADMDAEEIALRRARGDQYLSDAGVYYRRYGAEGVAERGWPLSHVPILIDETEWEAIGAGLVQRADLLEAVVADIYGENRLVARGDLPAALVAGNPEWLRPLVGVTPRGGHFLHFLAFDIGRGPQGQWWVLGDRAQAPSGAGFALENRIATTRIYPDHLARANVHRLAGFFRTFRDSLLALRGTERSRVGVLTPGPMNDTYFEHAYIARYLGFTLLEGEDLRVRDGRLMVRTVAGLNPVSVLWRRLDGAYADPLELAETSALGTPGLVGAVRAGNVTLVNALGSGIVETRALLAFLPRICEALTGAPLAIPNIATWWCGERGAREAVKANATRMSIGSAYSSGILFDANEPHAVAGVFNRDVGRSLPDWIDEKGGDLVGQEVVTLSTTPAFAGGGLVPRPMSLRVFLVRTADGWRVMPGGFARIGHDEGSSALALQHGGSAADVWVVADHPVPDETMLAAPSAPFVRPQPMVLPSRAADNLFWLGRYMERTEHTVRLLRAHNIRIAEAASDDTPVLAHSRAYLAGLGVDAAEGMPDALVQTVEAAAAAAAKIRDRFSVDGWNALSDLSQTIQSLSGRITPGDDGARAMGLLLRKMSSFSGLVHENMYRLTGWRFMSIGRAIERASSMTKLLAAFADPAAPEGSLDYAVEVADSEMSHRRRYAVATNRSTVVDLLALDPLNPRAVIHQLNDIDRHVEALPGSEEHRQLTPMQRITLKARAAFAVETPETLDTAMLLALDAEILAMSDILAASYLD
ncbi:circularly permuted type 2 ATP-grasp protein [Acuticoccus sp. M5D2P5]|uniref:circularly permuted type 2 ATP-grasp protein n=1 Tax=Acuticoccus kalidii TaxID=2910977 RepID=UPI001F23B526|nr:circularly permuted type 2 ATP-grasp protein [Acuticoccus kalidii]MCF3936599.1 circularly permuted type 2 ATP-grasp protein [Acuticoccus kalidii]